MGMQPFSDDVLTIIMGIDPDDPCKPGMHGPMKAPCPTEDATDLIIKIRDMCDKWLLSAGKDIVKDEMDNSDEPDDEPAEDGEEDV